MNMIVLDLKPISVNKIWRGGKRFKTKEYSEWIKDGLLLMGKKKTIKGDVIIHFDFYVKYPRTCDVDNFLKTAIDLLVRREWIKDDRQVQYLSCCKKQNSRERIELEIREL